MVRGDWRTTWLLAMNAMPYWVDKNKCKQGRQSLLMRLLGYSSLTAQGKPRSLSMHWNTNMCRGSKPRDAKAARLLEMLAGPNGTTIVRIIAIQRGLDLKKYTQWP